MADVNFNHFDEELQKVLAAAERGVEKAATKFQSDTMDVTHEITSTLRRSWTHKTTVNKDGSIEGVVGSNVEYAPYEDDYHPNISAALNENYPKYFETISNEIKTAMGG